MQTRQYRLREKLCISVLCILWLTVISAELPWRFYLQAYAINTTPKGSKKCDWQLDRSSIGHLSKAFQRPRRQIGFSN